MKLLRHKRVVAAFAVAALSVAGFRTAAAQQTWQATLGAQSKDMGRQVIAFLPNEMWIHAGDSITWTSASGDIHTVSFFIPGQPYETFSVGCPGYTPSGVSFTGSSCVSAPPLVAGQSYTVKFPVQGNFKLLCLVHPHMTGVIHVLASSAALPHDQRFYNQQAAQQQHDILADTDHAMNHQDDSEMDDMLSERVIPRSHQVGAGIGEMNATAGGFQSLSVVRFLKPTIEIHAGDTVEWSVLDPAEPHTITFGTEPANPGPPTSNVHFAADGSRYATITYVGESVSSGIIGAAPEDRPGVPQAAPAEPVFRITFTNPGTYDYKCALHDTLGMVGKVIVRP